MPDQLYQIIKLKLSDGRIIDAITSKFCEEGDKLYIVEQTLDVSKPQSVKVVIE